MCKRLDKSFIEMNEDLLLLFMLGLKENVGWGCLRFNLSISFVELRYLETNLLDIESLLTN